MTLNLSTGSVLTPGDYYYPEGSDPEHTPNAVFSPNGVTWVAGRAYTLTGTRGLSAADPDDAEGWNVYINGFTSGASGSFTPGVQSFVQTGLTIAINAGDEIVWQLNPLADGSSVRVNLTIQLEPR